MFNFLKSIKLPFNKKIITCLTILVVVLAIIYLSGLTKFNTKPIWETYTADGLAEKSLKVWAQTNYTGGFSKLKLLAGEHYKKFKNKEMIDNHNMDPAVIKSLKLPSGVIMVLFAKTDCTGAKRKIYGGARNWEDMSKINSWTIEIGSIALYRKELWDKHSKNPAIIYEGEDFTGDSAKLWVLPDEDKVSYKLNELEWWNINNDSVTSLEIPSGKWIVRGYRNDSFQGFKYSMKKTHLKLKDSQNNTWTSLTVERQPSNAKAPM
tara:strand:+ start:504 stop:1295 length:792 start_codon:yes stop_codon:yes gene_type:complete